MKIIAVAALGVLLASAAQAQVTQTTGLGSAVTTPDGIANFENPSSANGLPYVEGGMKFSNPFNSANPCGFAGCSGHPGFSGFSGGYLYLSNSTFWDIAVDGTGVFYGLEFMVGTGHFQSSIDVGWEAYLDGTYLTGGTTGSVSAGSYVGFTSVTGFDELRYYQNGGVAPALDFARADFGANTVTPEPVSMTLLGTGMAGIAAARRRRKQAKA